ncbi:hypothetical protein ACFLQN_01540 [Candidatus Aenigmatarchaeota archaeon]
MKVIKMISDIKYESFIEIDDMPIQWASRIELFYPDLPQFPIIYVHKVVGRERIYGFPVSFSITCKKNKTCSVKLKFLSNKNLEKNKNLKNTIKEELEHRIGTKNKIGLDDIIAACKGEKKYEKFFAYLWKYVSKIYGNVIPYGKLYEEIFSIVRFVSAWQPKTGRQSEMRMLYNFLSIFGEKIVVKGDWDYLEFFLLPTYSDMLGKNFKPFPTFNKLFVAMEKIWKSQFTQSVTIGDKSMSFMKKGWPSNKEEFINTVCSELINAGKITKEDGHNIERLIDAFNRHPWRASFFISSIMNAYVFDYNIWDKKFFIKFYSNKKGRGVSPKAIACFLQQGFLKDEFIPIDTWVESFHVYALGIATKDEFFKKFSKMGKLERVIWLSSQANKTNITTFFNTLWCTRFGVRGIKKLREANPISCYECELKDTCPGYLEIKDKLVLVKESDHVRLREETTPKGKFKGQVLDSPEVIEEASSGDCEFVCITKNSVPKKIIINSNGKWPLIDEHSGYVLDSTKKTNKINEIVTVDDFIKSLPKFN